MVNNMTTETTPATTATSTAIPDAAPLVEALTADEQAYEDSRGGEKVAPVKEVPAVEEKPAEPEAKAAEPKADKPDPEKEPEVEKLVKHGAFEEERQRRKKAEAA